MTTDKWLNPEEAQRDERIRYIRKMQSFMPLSCPECSAELAADEDHYYCTKCGLVVTASIRYVAGQKIDLPFGLLII